MSATAVLSRSGARLYLRGASSGLRGYALPRAQESARAVPALSALARYYASKSFPSHTVISMPALSPTMSSGNIGAWQKKVGDSLAPGDVLVEIETDKAQMDFEFQEEGVLAKILKDSGEKDVSVGSPIAVMVEDSGDVSAFESFTIDDAGGDKTPPASQPKQETSEASEPPQSGSGTEPPASKPAAQESESTGDKLETALDRQPNLSPKAKALALEKGVPIHQVKGTGPGGRVTVSDIEKYQPTAGAAGGPAYEDVPASSMRKTIAARLTQSMQQNPHYFVSSRMSVSKLLQLRAALNGSADGRYKLSVNDLLVKAIAAAARAVPAANASWREEAGGNVVIRTHRAVDVSVAVATPVGLMTPIIRGADALGLAQISAQAKALGKRARDGKLMPEEYQGGTITVSNMGMNDAVERFTAVINPPQAAIMAIGTVRKVAVPGEPETEGGEPSVVWDDQIVITGSFDHKVVDGAVGGEFMRELKRVVENPLEMML